MISRTYMLKHIFTLRESVNENFLVVLVYIDIRKLFNNHLEIFSYICVHIMFQAFEKPCLGPLLFCVTVFASAKRFAFLVTMSYLQWTC